MKVTTSNHTLGSWLAAARRELADVNPGESVILEPSLLAAHFLERPRSWVLAHPETSLLPEQKSQLDELLRRVAAGEPLSYITGAREFFGLSFQVSPAVLVPRPETEMLVERALHWLRDHPGRRNAVDVGTGSGCIAIALAHSVPDLNVAAVDQSQAALAVAQTNAAVHRVSSRLRFQIGDLLDSLAGPFDLVCANLPYVPTSDVISLPVGRCEPRLALDGGMNGLELIRRLLTQLPERLDRGGLALLEIEYRQGEAVTRQARNAFPVAAIRLLPDLSGLDRLVEIQTPE